MHHLLLAHVFWNWIRNGPEVNTNYQRRSFSSHQEYLSLLITFTIDFQNVCWNSSLMKKGFILSSVHVIIAPFPPLSPLHRKRNYNFLVFSIIRMHVLILPNVQRRRQDFGSNWISNAKGCRTPLQGLAIVAPGCNQVLDFKIKKIIRKEIFFQKMACFINLNNSISLESSDKNFQK